MPEPDSDVALWHITQDRPINRRVGEMVIERHQGGMRCRKA